MQDMKKSTVCLNLYEWIKVMDEIYIRTDMNNQIATGHVMRWLAIADALQKNRIKVNFIVADESALELLKKYGYKAIILYTKWNNKEAELPVLKKYIQKLNIKKMLIDSYEVTEKYLREVHNLVRVMYIDDLNINPYEVDALVCYANYWKKFHYDQSDNKIKKYLGVKYAPLRSVFWNCESHKIKNRVECLLLLTGGTDPYNIIRRVLDGIERDNFLKIEVICGVYNQNYDSLKEQYRTEKKIIFHKAVDNIEKYMQEADIAISAGGTTLYELCALGVPTISYAFVDNQLDNVKQFQADDIIDYAGDVREENIVDKINMYLKEYMNDMELRKKKSLQMQRFIDGKGAERITEALIAL